LRRYDKSRHADREELDARLTALKRSRPRQQRRKRRSNAPLVFGVLIVVCVVGAVYLIYASATARDERASEAPAKVEVVKGDTLDSVARKLEEAGVIDSAFMFKLEVRWEGRGTDIKTGVFSFGRGEDSDEILGKLTAGEAKPTTEITIPEGLTIEQTAAEVAQQSGVGVAAFERAARQTDYGYAFLEDSATKTTEGYLFPSRYAFEEDTTARQMVNRLLGQYLIETQGMDIRGATQRLNLSEYELITVASLVEKEAASDEERPLVASVIYNRLRRDMPLQIDASVHYALKDPKAELSLADLEVDSPYNTYENKGLPPGPICSPGMKSMRAATEPAKTDYLYYVLKADGREHFFTDDYDEFLKWKEKRDGATGSQKR
jgi:UPF0755 protein